MTADGLAWTDLAYAPPFSGVWDLIHIAARCRSRGGCWLTRFRTRIGGLPGRLRGLFVLLSACGSGASTSGPPVEATPAEVLRLFDGDSFLAMVDGAEEEVRLIGINAPESGECRLTMPAMHWGTGR